MERKEAIEIVRKLYNESLFLKKDKEAIVTLIPEIKENEDEMVRKSLIDLVINYGDRYGNKQNMLAWLEKQGEHQKFADNIVEIWKDMRLEVYQQASGNRHEPNYSDDTTKMYSLNDIDEIIEKMSEQKSFDYESANIQQKDFAPKSAMEAIKEEKVDNANKVEPKFKDGDVLYSPSHRLIWIYKDNEHYYACVNMNYVTKNIATNGLISIPNDACPATKDEQTILFARMKEAGYEWDADKKELKKIEHNLAWSEEDGNVLEDIEEVIINYWHGDTQDILLDWLKSLKDRVQPQPKQEWSEEDEKRVESLHGWLDTLVNYIHHDAIVSLDLRRERMQQVEQLKTWLKSFKDRYTWKPSDEQMAALNAITVNGCISYTGQGQDLAILYNDLKKLREE